MEYMKKLNKGANVSFAADEELELNNHNHDTDESNRGKHGLLWKPSKSGITEDNITTMYDSVDLDNRETKLSQAVEYAKELLSRVMKVYNADMISHI
jgi:WD40 repeat protein